MAAPSTHVIYRSVAEIRAAWEYSQQMHIPIVMILGCTGCVHCDLFRKNILGSDEFNQWLQSDSPYMWIEGGYNAEQGSDDYNLVRDYIIQIYEKIEGKSYPGGGLLIIAYYWDKGDGSAPVFRLTEGNSSHTGSQYEKYPTWKDYRSYLQNTYDIDAVEDKSEFEPPTQRWTAGRTMESNVWNLTYDSASKKYKAILYNGHWDWKPYYGGRFIENLQQLYFAGYTPTPPPEDTKFSVVFKDWDGTVLRSAQNVLIGENADPPPDPQRAGYKFSGWQPSYTNIQCDTVCVAQYTKDPEVKKYTSPRTVESICYDTTAMKYSSASGTRSATVTDNVDNYSFVGVAEHFNSISSDLLSVSFGSSVATVGPSCFMNCKSLTDASFPPNLKVVKDYAFAGCASLSNVSMLRNGDSFCEIGSHAFDGCDSLVDIRINLSGTNRSTFILDHAFANCKNLRSAKWTNSSYLASYMFEGCSSLSSLQLNRYTSYVYPYSLAGIPNITSVEIPNSIWFLNEGMFQGDSSLKYLTIEDTQQHRSVMNQVGANAFSGCRSLTAVTLPQSINALSCLSEAMLSGSSIQRVTFSGMSDEIFCTNYTEDRPLEYSPSALYIDSNDVAAVIALCQEKNIPIVLIQSRTGKNENGSWLCSICAKFHKNVLSQQYFKDWLAGNDKYFFAFGDYDKIEGNAYQVIDKVTSSKKTGTYFLNVYIWWPRSSDYDSISLNFNGSAVNSKFPTAESFVSQIQQWFAAYEGSGGGGTVIRDTLSKFGSPLEQVTYVSNTGHEFVVTKDTVLTPEPDVQVDAYTTDDFKYGIWYYNAKQLRQYADENGIPVLAEYSSAGCDPCQYFKKHVFLNSEFQNWVKKSPYLFCKVDIKSGESFQNEKLYPQPYYIDNVWAKEKYGDNPPSIPVFMWYWKPRGEQSPRTFELSTYHFAPNALGTKPPFDMDQLIGDTDARFASYQREEGHDAPTATRLYSSAGVWVGNVYPNQVGDDNGRYYACKTKTRVQKYEKTFELSGYPVIGSVEEGGVVPYPDGTYQMFDMSAEKSYQSYLAGVIFRSDSNVVSYVYSYDNTEGSNPDGQKYRLGEWYELSSDDYASVFEDIVLEAENLDYTVVVLKGGQDQQAELFRKQVLESDEFKRWMAKDDIKKRYFVNVSPSYSSYSSGIGAAVKDFVVEPFRNDPSWTIPAEWASGSGPWNDKRQVFYVYMACRSCVTKGSDPKPTINSIVDGNDKSASEVISGLEAAFADVN